MAASISGIWNHSPNQGALHSAYAVQGAVTDASTGGSGDDDGSATISANDFLTLLVTEMQNQDPTADTDPNEYIDQLVQVNSLEQLISINQTLTADSTSATPGKVNSPGNTQDQASQAGASHPPSSAPAHVGQSASESPVAPQPGSGNLTIPATNAAALRVAEALSGQMNKQ